MKCIVYKCQYDASLTSLYCARCNYQRKRSALYEAEQKLKKWQEKLAELKKQLQDKRAKKKAKNVRHNNIA